MARGCTVGFPATALLLAFGSDMHAWLGILVPDGSVTRLVLLGSMAKELESVKPR